MKILEVQLNNVKSYTNQTVRFEHGTNCICGENGAGKTTIVEAVGWALFDSLPYSQKQFKREGSVASAVSVIFEARDGREYEVVRKIGGGAPHWFVFDIEIRDRVAEGSNDVRDWLARNLGVDDTADPQVLFENAVGVPQGGLTAPFLQSAERRKQAFDPILRVHEFGEAFTHLRETASYLEDHVRDQQGLAATHGVEADKIPQLTQTMLTLHDTIVSTEHRLSESQKEKTRQEAQVSALEAEERRLAEIRQNAELRRQAIEGARVAYEQVTTRLNEAWQAHETVERCSVAHKLYTAAQERLSELRPRHEQYRALVAEQQGLDRELARLSAERQQRTQDLQRAEATAACLPELKSKADEAADLGKRLHTLEQTTRQLPRLEADLRRKTTRLLQARQELEQLSADIAAAEARESQAATAPALERQTQDLSFKVREAEQASEHVSRLRRDVVALETEIQTVRATVRDREAASFLNPEVEQLAASVPALRAAEEQANATVNDLLKEHAEAKAQKEARSPACPLARADCLAIQNDPERERRLEEELARIRAAGVRARAELEAATARRAEGERARETVANVRVVRAEYQAAQQTLKDREGRYAELKAEVDTRQAQADQFAPLRQQHATLLAELAQAQAAQRDVQRLPDLRTTRDRQVESIQQLEASKAQLRAEVGALQDQSAQLQELRARAVALAEATKAYTEALGLASTAPQLRAAVDTLSQEHEAATIRRSQQGQELESLAGVESAVRQTEAAITKYRGTYEAYLGSYKLAEELPTRQVEQKQLEAELQKRQAESEQQQAALETALQAWNPEALSQARGKVQEYSREIGTLSATVSSDTRRLDELRAELALCEQHAEEREKALGEAARLSDLRDILQFARTTLKAAQGPVTEALLHGVSQEARSLFSDIVEDHSARLTWTPDYEIQLERGPERLVMGQMSGGEQMSAALAVRLALLKTLSDIDVAFLDEPTQNMDETRRTNLAAQVREVKGFTQLFVISHDDTFERQVSHAVVVRKEKGESVVSYGHED